MFDISTKTARKENYGASRSLTDINYIAVHYTGNLGDTAKNNADYFAREIISPSASAHFFVDETSIWESVPVRNIAWHVGAKKYYHPKCRNANSVGVEICMLDKKGYIRQGSIETAVTLVRELMKTYNVPIENVVRHYDVTHKSCPEPMVKNSALWTAFKHKLTEVIPTPEKEGDEEEEMKTYTSVSEMPTWAQPTFTKLVDKGIVAKDSAGKIAVQECSIQPMIYMDRLGYIK